MEKITMTMMLFVGRFGLSHMSSTRLFSRRFSCGRVLSLLLWLFFPMAVLGYESVVDPDTGLLWKYVETDGGVLLGTGEYPHPAIDQKTKGALTVPAKINGLDVVGIGDYAFCGCASLTSISIPDSVVSIGAAFQGCSALKSVDFPETVKQFNASFSDCTSLAVVNLPSSLREIGSSAFHGCTSLKSLFLPWGVEKIGRYAFYGCRALTSINIPLSVKEIEQEAFSGCTGLGRDLVVVDGCVLTVNDKSKKTYKLPNGVRLIAGSAFSDCKTLTSVTLQEGVKRICANAFYRCTNLKKMVIPSGVTHIDMYAFAGCSALTKVEIPKSVTDIGMYAFSWCSGLGQGLVVQSDCLLAVNGNCPSEVNIPEGVRMVADHVFGHSSAVRALTIPSSVKIIGKEAFFRGGYIDSLMIPNGVEDIRESAFDSCGVRRVTIPSSVTNIARCAFRCGGTYFDVDKRNPQYKSINGFLLSKDGMRLIGGVNDDVVIPDGVASICESAFVGCDALTSVTIPPTVTNIETGAFCYCLKLKKLTIPSGVISIDYGAFQNCSELTSVTIPSSVTSIGGSAFAECDKLSTVYVDLCDRERVRALLTESGLDCSAIEVVEPSGNCYVVTFDANGGSVLQRTRRVPAGWFGELPAAKRDGYEFLGWFTSPSGGMQVSEMTAVNEDVTWYAHWQVETPIAPDIPEEEGDGDIKSWTDPQSGIRWTYTIVGEGDAALGVFGWDNQETAISPLVEGDVQIPSSVASRSVVAIEPNAFAYCTNLISVTIPSSVKGIGNGAFEGCTGLASVIFTDGVESIGKQAFADCSGLISIRIPSSVVDIGEKAFLGCNSLEEILVDSNNEKYCDVGGVLYDKLYNVIITCPGAKTKVEILSGVSRIGDYAFAWCERLAQVEIPDSVTEIGIGAFCECRSLINISIPSGIRDIPEFTFSGCASLAELNITPNVKSIGDFAFSECANLSNVTIPSSVINVGECAFGGCDRLVSISVERDNAYYKSENGLLLSKDGKTLIQGVGGNVVVPGGVTRIADGAFEDCRGLTSIEIPSSVRTIGQYAFYGCSNLIRIAMSAGLTDIDFYAFGRCDGLTSVVLPQGVVSIGGGAFDECAGLISVSLPSSVTEIDEEAFRCCGNLMKIDVDSKNANYKSVNGLLLTKDGKELIQGVGGDVKIPAGVTVVDMWAFASNDKLRSVKIPKSVMSIGERAFIRCGSLKSLTVDSGNSAYKSVDGVLYDKQGKTLCVCPGVKESLTIPAGVTCIGDFSCCGRRSLKSVTIPSSVKEIRGNAFLECNNLSVVYVDKGDSKRIQSLYDWEDSDSGWGNVKFIEIGGGSGSSEATGPFDMSVANTFNGVLIDEDGNPKGYIVVTTAKASGKGNSMASKVTVSVQTLDDPKMVTIKDSVGVMDSGLEQTAFNGHVLDRLEFSHDTIEGMLDGCEIVGVRNLLTSTAKADKGTAEKAAADAAFSALKGNYVMVYEDDVGWNGVTFAVESKGKVKISVQLADGTKVSATSQLIIGADCSIVPIVISAEGVPEAFNVYFSNDGREIDVRSSRNAEISAVGDLGQEKSFYCNSDEIVRLFWNSGSYSYWWSDFESKADPDDLYAWIWATGMRVCQVGKKWIVGDNGKNGKVRIYYDKNEQADIIDDSKTSNPSDLKLTYDTKTGVFKGTFKVYTYNIKSRVKSFSASVLGVVVNGVGYGTAVIKGRGCVPVLICSSDELPESF